jgi:holo-[acyl-carrier protein] synthase
LSFSEISAFNMIIGTGIDIIEVERIAHRVGRDNGFKEFVFSKDEISYCEAKASPFEHFAARFAAKEAFLKAIGRGWDSGLQWNEIEIVNEKGGRPALFIRGITEKTLEPLGIRIIHLSLSHLKSMATAVVILES